MTNYYSNNTLFGHLGNTFNQVLLYDFIKSLSLKRNWKDVCFNFNVESKLKSAEEI